MSPGPRAHRCSEIPATTLHWLCTKPTSLSVVPALTWASPSSLPAAALHRLYIDTFTSIQLLVYYPRVALSQGRVKRWTRSLMYSFFPALTSVRNPSTTIWRTAQRMNCSLCSFKTRAVVRDTLWVTVAPNDDVTYDCMARIRDSQPQLFGAFPRLECRRHTSKRLDVEETD